MKCIRHLVLLVLLLTVPFQAAVGAGGMLCAAMMQDGPSMPMAAQGHDAAGMSNAGHHAQVADTSHLHMADASHLHMADASHSQMADGHHSAAPQADGQDGSDTSGKCKTCNECSSPAVPVLLATASMLPPDTPLRVSTLVDPELVSRTGDGLFRPPRTPSV